MAHDRRPSNVVSMLLAGTSTGLLLGALVGLSASPIVGTLVGALVTVAGMFLGFSSSGAVPVLDADTDLRRLGAAALSAACLFGVVGGIALRSRDALAPTPKQLVGRWVDAGFDASRAREIVATRETGITPAGMVAVPSTAVNQARNTLLFGATTSDCSRTSPADHPIEGDLERAFTLAGNKWHALATAAGGLDPKARASVLAAAWALACQ